ncbi:MULTISPECIES: 3-deoxy-D-manno-octulosonic acid kinase [unclassified Thioalkalivibrio]|uniref:3-deoxy-D-manno-octulosonic acid kinase n=1 Tax=unclassified Thioalkalivibrio TaxID=2621013 RepID=UPI00036B177B
MPDDNRVHIPNHRPDAGSSASPAKDGDLTPVAERLAHPARNRWILHDTSLLPEAAEELFQPHRLQQQGSITETRIGRRATHFLNYDGLDLVLRHYWRGGWVARLSEDRYLWTGRTRTRPVREWNLTRILYEQGLPVPRPVAARVMRHGLVYSGDLVTATVSDATPLDEWIQQQEDTPTLWHEVGATLARFHQFGAWHADLNVRNILVQPSGKVWLIDWDRGRLSVQRGLQGNLERLRRSLEKWPEIRERGRTGWSELLSGYRSARGGDGD